MVKPSDNVLNGVLQAINVLIEKNNLNEALDQMVMDLAITFESDCFLSKIYLEKKKWVSHTEFFWLKILDQERVKHNQHLILKAFGDIKDRLDQGEVVSLKYSNASKKVKSHFNKTGGKSVLLVPIIINSGLWGILAMADQEVERDWPDTVKSTLSTLAKLIGSKVEEFANRTELKSEIDKTSKALRDQNERYLSLLDNVPGIIFRCKNDKHWSMEFINSFVKTITGYDPLEFLDHKNGIHFNDIIHKSDKLEVREDVAAQLEQGDHYRTTYRILTKDKEVKWLWEQGVRISEGGDDYHLEGCIVDITDRVNGHERILSATLAAEERVRSRVSRTIHDNLQQLLITAHMNLLFLKKRRADFTEKEIRKYEIVNDYLQKAIEESRSISHKLMPKAIEDYGFEEAVEGLIENIDDVVETNFNFYNNLNGDRLSAKVELCLFRITQEAVSNVIKYAHANNCTIQLMKHQGSVMLTIEDDGVGFDKSNLELNADSFGINSMRNRASSVGGQFFIDTQLKKGTQLIVEIPY